MKQTINDLLLSLAESAQEERFKLTADIAIYKKLAKELPRLFPMPDEFFTRSAVALDHDATMVYLIQDNNEHPESLRTVLSIMFGLSDWEIEIDKVNMFTCFRAIKRLGNYSLLIRIAGVNLEDFDYVIHTDTGTTLIGLFTCKKFMEFETPRDDVSPEIFYDRLQASSYQSFVCSKQAYISSIAALGLSPKLPLPDEVIPALGTTYDLDLSYFIDSRGLLRSKIDKLVPYTGWGANIEKLTGNFSLHTIVPIKCKGHILQVRINILQAKREKEQLFLLVDLQDRLVYRAVRESDPDYLDVVKAMSKPDGTS